MEDFGTMTWADVAREEEEHWNRPKCKHCGDDFGLNHKITYPWGETEWFCDECWKEMQDDEE